MLYADPGSRPPRPHIRFPFQTSRRLTKRHLLLSALLLIVILSGVIAGWSTGILRTHADGPLDSAPAGMTFDQFINEGRLDTAYHGPLVFPSPTPPPPASKWRHYTNYATLPPSVEPATMQPLTSALNSTFLTGSTGSQALDLKGSDGRLEVQVSPGSLNLTHATVSGGSTPVGAISLHLVQLYGHTIGQKSVLGTYQLATVQT